MSSLPPTLTILRSPAWPALQRRLDRALAEDRRMEMARDVLLRPLELLELMAQEAPGALADDVVKAERLRLLLQLALPFIGLPREASEFSNVDADGIAGSGSTYQPGIIDHGALLMVALAAIRVAPPRMPPIFLQAVHGVALAAAPAEVLGRLGADQPDARALAVILKTFYLLDTVRAAMSSPLLRPFAGDPYERGRWRCLARLLEHQFFRHALDDAGKGLWDGAVATGIDRVEPIQAEPGDTVIVAGDIHAYRQRLQSAHPIQPVFAAPNLPPLPAAVAGWNATARGLELRLIVPEDATPGWIGFSDDQLIAASNRYRRALREALRRLFSDEPCLRGSESLPRTIPLLERPDPTRPGHLLAVPPRTAGNEFRGGRPRIVYYEPATVSSDGTLTFSWDSVGADYIRLDPAGTELAPSGDARMAAPPGGAAPMTLIPARRGERGPVLGSPITLVIAAPSVNVRIAKVDVHQGERRRPLFVGQPLQVDVWLDPPAAAVDVSPTLTLNDGEPPIVPSSSPSARGVVSFVVEPTRVQNDAVLNVFVRPNAVSSIVAERRIGPLRLESPRSVAIVLVRPAVLKPDRSPITFEDARAAVDRAATRSGLTARSVDLPWLDDPLAVLVQRPSSSDDPHVLSLLEHLARRALLTPGHESALWLVLLPGPAGATTDISNGAAGRQVLMRYAPATAARAVAVAEEAALPALFAAVFADSSADSGLSDVTARLRILGVMKANDVEVDSVREEQRGAGLGSAVATSIIAVTLDRGGNELTSHRVKVMRETRPALLGLLLPVSAEVVAVELRSAERTVARFERPPNGPKLTDVAVDGENTLTWRYSHPDGVRPEVQIALQDQDLTTIMFVADECAPSNVLPLWRFRKPKKIVVSASDGWHVEEELLEPPEQTAGPVLIRRLSDGRFFADVPDGWHVAWSVEDGPSLGNTPVIHVAPRGRPQCLVLQARASESSAPVIDKVIVEAAIT